MNNMVVNLKVLVVKRIILCMVCASMLFAACNDAITVPEGALDEHLVDIRGDWVLQSVIQNETDISERMSFTNLSLRLEMAAEGPTDYQIETAGLPFVVIKNGTWSFDDLTYPTMIMFTSPDRVATVMLDRPPISGGDFLSFSFSLGCEANSYVYEFKKQ